MGNFGDRGESRVRHRDHSDVWIDRAERIIFCWRLVSARDRIEERRFPDVRQTDNSRAQHSATDEHRFTPTNCIFATHNLCFIDVNWWPKMLSGWRDLNPRPLEPHSSVLPS